MEEKTLKEAREAKAIMELKISKAVYEFEEVTGLEVEAIGLDTITRAYSATTGGASWKKIRTEVKL